jgi:hypothetical protein
VVILALLVLPKEHYPWDRYRRDHPRTYTPPSVFVGE